MWGHGLATEATRAVLEWGFGEGRLRHVVAVIHPENHASRRVAEKCGLTYWKDVPLPGSDTFHIYHTHAPAAGR